MKYHCAFSLEDGSELKIDAVAAIVLTHWVFEGGSWVVINSVEPFTVLVDETPVLVDRLS